MTVTEMCERNSVNKLNEPHVSVTVKMNSHGLTHLCALFYT